MRRRMENLAYFQDLYANAHKQISRRECADLVHRTADEMALVLQGERAVYGWSGGKESVVLEYILRLVGVYAGVCVSTRLEYPCVDEFVLLQKPKGLEVVRTAHDLRWLLERPRMLFPQDARTKSEWYRLVQQHHTDEFAMRSGATMLVLGRRVADGNTIRAKVYSVAGKARRYNPLMEFTHLQIWGIVRHFELPEYPLYSRHATSLVTGTGAWAQEPSWDVVRETDERLYKRVRKYFPYDRH